MSNEQNTQTHPSANKSAILGYTITNLGVGRKAVWSKIAAAWAHKDGDGYQVRMDALPVDGRLVLRAPKDDPTFSEEPFEQGPPGRD